MSVTLKGKLCKGTHPTVLKWKMYRLQLEVKASHELCEQRIDLQKIELLVLSAAPVREVSRYVVMQTL
jgi:hypothetical protein